MRACVWVYRLFHVSSADSQIPSSLINCVYACVFMCVCVQKRDPGLRATLLWYLILDLFVYLFIFLKVGPENV